MTFKNKGFAHALCAVLDCAEWELAGALESIFQMDMESDAEITLYRNRHNHVQRLNRVMVSKNDFVDIDRFEHLRSIAVTGMDRNNKVYVHKWPVGLEHIAWRRGPFPELLSNLARFPALTHLQLGRVEEPACTFPNELKERLNLLEAGNLDTRQLQGFRQLEALTLCKPKAFADMPTLECVREFTGARMEGMEGIAAMPNLRRATMENCQITDLSPLSKLEKLGAVNLQHNYIHNVAPLVNAKGLDVLVLRDNLVESISALARKNLTYLDISSNPLGSVKPLEGHSNLRHLNVRDTFVTDITPLAELPSLEELWLDVEKLTDRGQLLRLAHVKSINGMEYGECLWTYKVGR